MRDVEYSIKKLIALRNGLTTEGLLSWVILLVIHLRYIILYHVKTRFEEDKMR